jgi:multicomponent Na+:H+ antiporter subunit D
LDTLLVLPILIPLATAALTLIAARALRIQRALSFAGMASLLITGIVILLHVDEHGIAVAQAGGWAAPYGITLVADRLSALLVTAAGVVGLATTVFTGFSLDRRRERASFYPLLNVLLMGVCGSFLTGDLFNLYVCFEVMLMASFVLLTLGGTRAQLEGGLKYLILNLVSSAIFLTAGGLLYRAVGTLNMADIAEQVAAYPDTGLMDTLAMLFLVAFGLKAAMFPFFFWLPASYHTPPPVVSAVFAGLLSKVGVYALLRTFTMMFTGHLAFTHTVLAVLACATMIAGVLGAVAQMEIRRILSFQIVSSIGFLILGLALMSKIALAGAVFYLLHNIVVKTNLFFLAGVIEKLRGHGDLRRLGGLWRERPVLSVLFLVSALSLAGIPPLSGFWAKLVLLRAGLEGEWYWAVGIAVVVALLTLYSMTKIWALAFWKDAPTNEFAFTGRELEVREKSARRAMLPVVALTIVTVAIGFLAGPIFEMAMATAEQLLDPSQYVTAVLGGVS